MMMENKQAICDKLCECLKLTRLYDDLEMLNYNKSCEEVTAYFKGNNTKRINVAMDSGASMVRDIMRGLA